MQTSSFFLRAAFAAALVTGLGLASTPANAIGCEKQFRIKSKNSNTPTTITFRNMSSTMRGLTWIDFKGGFQDFGFLEVGETKTLKTFLTHPWMVTSGPGDCLHIILPRAGGSRETLTD